MGTIQSGEDSKGRERLNGYLEKDLNDKEKSPLGKKGENWESLQGKKKEGQAEKKTKWWEKARVGKRKTN